jgi:hypothetical protein
MNKNSYEIGKKNGLTITIDDKSIKDIVTIKKIDAMGNVKDSIDLNKNERIPERFIPER